MSGLYIAAILVSVFWLFIWLRPSEKVRPPRMTIEQELQNQHDESYP
jgi:hypothetical protein